MPLTPQSRIYENKLKNNRKKNKAKDDFAFNRNVKGNALANKQRMETSRNMMKVSEVKNTSVDEGPPSIGRPSMPASNISGEDPFAVFGAYGAKLIGDAVRSPLYKYTNNPITVKASDYLFPKYNEDPRTVGLAEQQRMASGLLENFPLVGDIASIAASGATLKQDPSLKNLGLFGLNTGLSLLNPVGGSGQVKNVTKGIVEDLGIRATKKDTAKTVEEMLQTYDQEVAAQQNSGLLDNPMDVVKMEEVLNKENQTYESVRRVLDPNDPYDLNAFKVDNPNGEITLPRSDLEKFLKENNLSYADAAGKYQGPVGKDMTDNVTLRLAEHTLESKKAALQRQGQSGNKRMVPILAAMDTLFAKAGVPPGAARNKVLKTVREKQTKGMTPEQLERIYSGKEVALFEKTSKGEWARVDHADHLIPIHKVKVRIQQLADMPGSVKAKKAHKDTALAYLEFVNSVDNFRGEHGMTNIRKSADMPDEYINKLLSADPKRITQADMPTYLALQGAVKKLKALVGEEEYTRFLESL